MQQKQNKHSVIKGLAFPIGYTLFMNVFQSLCMIAIIFLVLAPVITALMAVPEIGTDAIVTQVMNRYTDMLNANTWFLSALTTIVALLVLWFVFNRKGKSFAEYFRFTKAPAKAIVAAVLLGLSWFFLTNGVMSVLQEALFALLDRLFAYLEETALMDISPVIDVFYEVLNAMSQMYDGVGMFTIAAIIGAPLIEEIVFRAGPLTHLTKKMPVTAAVLLTSALFAIAHGNPIQMVYTFVLGLFAGYLFVKSDSIYPAIICHFVFNGANLISMVMQSLFDTSAWADQPYYPQLVEKLDAWSITTFWVYTGLTCIIAIPMLIVGIILLCKLRCPIKHVAEAAQPVQPVLSDGVCVIAAEENEIPEQPEQIEQPEQPQAQTIQADSEAQA